LIVVGWAKICPPYYLLYPDQQKRFNVIIGVDYPQPVVDLFKSADENKRIYEGVLSKVFRV
jgi:deoxyribodipyrimidine photo-lyase